MKQEKVIELAKKAGFVFYDMKDAGCGESVEADSFGAATLFAALVEQATLERAAQECDKMEDVYWNGDGASAASGCAHAIRALSKEQK